VKVDELKSDKIDLLNPAALLMLVFSRDCDDLCFARQFCAPGGPLRLFRLQSQIQ
jgi:hypothetical protein